jgi:putative NIF3 family GTP cyclohydrolase 1 type 2
MAADVSLFGYHLPLDAHPRLGNNVGVLRAIGCEPTVTFSAGQSVDGWIGEPAEPTPLSELLKRIERFSVVPPLVLGDRPELIRKVGICTGGGAGFFEAAVAAGCDLFISGEPSEMAQGLAHELGAIFVAAGHHATERFGPQLLGEHMSDKFDIDVQFVDISNPV